MAIVKAEYYRLNGSEWDLYYFKTTADLIAETADFKVLTGEERTKIADYLTTFNAANKLLQLDGSGKIPLELVPDIEIPEIPEMPDMSDYLHRSGGALMAGTGGRKITNIKELQGASTEGTPSGDIIFNAKGVRVGSLGPGTNNTYVDLSNEGDIKVKGLVDVQGNRITGLAAPTDPSDAISKQWAEQMLVSGTHLVAAVAAATTAQLPGLSGLKVVDGVSLVEGDRVLVKDQTPSTENGVYQVETGSWVKLIKDSDRGSLTYVLQGTVNKGSQFYTMDGSEWNMFSSARDYFATPDRGLVVDETGRGFGIKDGGVKDAMIEGPIFFNKLGDIPVTATGGNKTWEALETLFDGNQPLKQVIDGIVSAIGNIRGENFNAFHNSDESIEGAYLLARTKSRVATGASLPPAAGFDTGDVFLKSLT